MTSYMDLIRRFLNYRYALVSFGGRLSCCLNLLSRLIVFGFLLSGKLFLIVTCEPVRTGELFSNDRLFSIALSLSFLFLSACSLTSGIFLSRESIIVLTRAI